MTQPQHTALTAHVLDEQYASATAEAARIAARLTDEQGRWRPAPGSWSVADCLAHLTVTAQLYLPVLESAVQNAPPAAGVPRPFTPGVFGRWMIASMEPPPKRRLRAPRAIEPPPPPPIDAALREFVAAQAAMRALLEKARSVELGGVSVRSPIAPLLRMKLGTALAFLAAHERRHLWQAEQVRAAPGFPR